MGEGNNKRRCKLLDIDTNPFLKISCLDMLYLSLNRTGFYFFKDKKLEKKSLTSVLNHPLIARMLHNRTCELMNTHENYK